MESVHNMMRQLGRDEMDALLSTSRVGRLGLSVNDNTYVVPVSYWYRDGKIYFHSSEGKKIDYIKKNPQACFEVDGQAEDRSWKSVIAYGKVTLKADNLGRYLGWMDIAEMTGRKEV